MRISYKYLGRYKEIAGVLIKYGFGFIVDRLNKDSISAKVVGHGPSIKSKSMTTAQRLKCALEELGPTYIKILYTLLYHTIILLYKKTNPYGLVFI